MPITKKGVLTSFPDRHSSRKDHPNALDTLEHLFPRRITNTSSPSRSDAVIVAVVFQPTDNGSPQCPASRQRPHEIVASEHSTVAKRRERIGTLPWVITHSYNQLSRRDAEPNPDPTQFALPPTCANVLLNFSPFYPRMNTLYYGDNLKIFARKPSNASNAVLRLSSGKMS